MAVRARQPRFCAARLELIRAYAARAREFGHSVHVLSDALAAREFASYERLHDATEAARRKAELARVTSQVQVGLADARVPLR